MDAKKLLPRMELNTIQPAPLASIASVKAAYAIRASLACLQCRSRHLKCDANQPSCSQCRLKNVECAYTKSRRGGSDNSRKTPQKRADQIQQRRLSFFESPTTNGQLTFTMPYIDYPVLSSHSSNSFLPWSTSSFTSSTAVSSSQIAENNATLDRQVDSHNTITELPSPKGIEESPRSEKLVHLYYKFFHDAHPFVLPITVLMNQWRCDDSMMQPLMLAIQFVGSMYTDKAGPEIRSKAFRAVFESNGHPNGYLVQAYLLLAIALHCNDELENARESLDVTIHMAVDLGMGMREYAVQNGAGNRVLEESWRRTWWMIYICDCIFAGIRLSPTILLRTVISTVDLPCEDENYKRGDIPVPNTQEEYNHRDFADQEIIFSSFSYLIDAAQILGSVLVLYEYTSKSVDRTIAEVDTSLVSWSLNLPKEKLQLVRFNGEVDELLFTAHVIINTGAVHLHRPRSHLDRSPLEVDSICRFSEDIALSVTSQVQSTLAFHTAKALVGAKSSITLFALPVSLAVHSPLLFCYLAFSTTVYLSACRLIFRGDVYREAKDLVRVSIGAFKHYRFYFPISERTLGKLKGIARDAFEMGEMGTGKRNVAEKPGDQTNPEITDSEMFGGIFGQLETVDPWVIRPGNLVM